MKRATRELALRYYRERVAHPVKGPAWKAYKKAYDAAYRKRRQRP